MKYIFIEFEGCKYWIEVDDEGGALRQIIKDEENRISVSCLEPCLADQYVDTENDCVKIKKIEFEDIWEKAVLPYREIWNEEKQKYLKGEKITGIIKYFYPHGAILALDSMLGCADIDDCNGKPLYPGYKISGIVSGFNEENMWILISDCELCIN